MNGNLNDKQVIIVLSVCLSMLSTVVNVSANKILKYFSYFFFVLQKVMQIVSY